MLGKHRWSRYCFRRMDIFMILVHAHALVFSAFSKSTRSACTCTIPGALKSVHHKVFESTFTWRSIGNWFHVENFGTIHNDRSDAESFCKRDGIIRVYEVDAARHQMSKWKKNSQTLSDFVLAKASTRFIRSGHRVQSQWKSKTKMEFIYCRLQHQWAGVYFPADVVWWELWPRQPSRRAWGSGREAVPVPQYLGCCS